MTGKHRGEHHDTNPLKGLFRTTEPGHSGGWNADDLQDEIRKGHEELAQEEPADDAAPELAEDVAEDETGWIRSRYQPFLDPDEPEDPTVFQAVDSAIRRHQFGPDGMTAVNAERIADDAGTILRIGGPPEPPAYEISYDPKPRRRRGSGWAAVGLGAATVGALTVAGAIGYASAPGPAQGHTGPRVTVTAGPTLAELPDDVPTVRVTRWRTKPPEVVRVTPAPLPAPTVTVTRTARPAPRPTVTVTETRVRTRTLEPKPAPTVTITVTPTP